MADRTEEKIALLDHEIFTKHDDRFHPENAARLFAIRDKIDEEGLSELAVILPAREASIAELLLGHSEEHITHVRTIQAKGGTNLDPDTYVTEHSYEAALRGVGGTFNLVEAVIQGKFSTGFALPRPPGHHATPSRSMGFCLFSTVALAALHLVHDLNVDRIAIIDFDAHHGNGTQEMVENHPEILYISTHQYPFYPGTGNMSETGGPLAMGTNLNIPLPASTGDIGIRAVFERIVIPSITRFSPQFILCSAGYDGHWRDPLANLNFSLETFTWITSHLINLATVICQGRIVFCLEGGYEREVLGQAVANALWLMTGNPGRCCDPLGSSPSPEPDLSSLLEQLGKIHTLP